MEKRMDKKKIYIAGGCFWGVQKFYDQFDGILQTTVGYANGNKENPSYEEVCSSLFGFVECVEIIYDANVISLDKIIDLFFKVVDPTQVNKQGHDIGLQYRNGIYSSDIDEIEKIKNFVNPYSSKYDQPISTEIKLLDNFYSAEEYHQNYLDKNPGGYCHIDKCMFNLQ